MNQAPKSVNILLVDDKPDNLLVLESVLSDLRLNPVRASSGRDALRHLLHEEFAVILLDVNMPGMDGFETAALIRQRPSTAQVPIIFVTASGDAEQLSRGYSLGAVDYILTPVIPEILRTKVSVLVDLYRKTEQIQRQAAALQRRADQLNKLAAASIAINSACTTDAMLRTIADGARDMIASRRAVVALALAETPLRVGCAVSQSAADDPPPRVEPVLVQQRFPELLSRISRTLRMTERDLEEAPLGDPADSSAAPWLPAHGCLATPLVGREGRSIGFILLADKPDGEFTADDEVLLTQLGQTAAIAVENILFAAEREASRMKDQFLSTLSHELRTPLNAIMGWTQILHLETLEPQVAEAVSVIDRNARAQQRLIEDLLDVSRITTGKFHVNCKPMTMGPVVRAAMDAIRPSAEEKKVAIEASLSGTDLAINGDPDRLQQVVWNLLTNAVKFTPAGGRIEIRVAPVNAFLQIRVSDTGRGISASFLPRVFDRFQQDDSTSKRTQTGLGLGLTIVRHIVERHGGTVHAESPGLEQGSTFTVQLPLAAEQKAAGDGVSIAAGDEAAESANLDGVSVLLVEDNDDGRAMIAHLLGRAKVQVTATSSVQEALALFPRTRPDVIVSDLAMPHQDGFDLIRYIRNLTPELGGATPAVALTAYAHEDDRARCLAAGFQRHITKPVKPAELLAVVAELTRSRGPAAELAASIPRLDSVVN